MRAIFRMRKVARAESRGRLIASFNSLVSRPESSQCCFDLLLFKPGIAAPGARQLPLAAGNDLRTNLAAVRTRAAALLQQRVAFTLAEARHAYLQVDAIEQGT